MSGTVASGEQRGLISLCEAGGRGGWTWVRERGCFGVEAMNRICAGLLGSSTRDLEQPKTVDMKSEYDFLTMKARNNPYASKLKKSVTIRMYEDVVTYFKAMTEETGVPYQSLINLYLRDCLAQNRRLQISWPTAA